MNYRLIPGDDASFGLVIKDYCTFTGTIFISFQMPTCHLCGIILPLKILLPAELIKWDCLFVSIRGEAACVCLGICYVCSSHCPLQASKVLNQTPKTARLASNHRGFLNKLFWFPYGLLDTELGDWFRDTFSGIFQACWGPEITHLFLIVINWDSDVISWFLQLGFKKDTKLYKKLPELTRLPFVSYASGGSEQYP